MPSDYISGRFRFVLIIGLVLICTILGALARSWAHATRDLKVYYAEADLGLLINHGHEVG